VEAGPLSNSRFIEPIGEMNIHFGFFLGKGPVVAPSWVQI
jgi:predicted dinucleotide-binding enzyme